MKHVGKMKNNGAKVAIAFRTLPGDPYSALVVGTSGLGDSYHDSLMTLIQEPGTQEAWELADVLSVRTFPDGSNMLTWLHSRGHLKKVATNGVLVTPTLQTSIPLDELNVLIAEQKGISVEDLAVKDEKNKSKKTDSKSVNEGVEVTEVAEISNVVEDTSPAALRSKADRLYKEAAALRKQADELDPPKKKSTKVTEAI